MKRIQDLHDDEMPWTPARAADLGGRPDSFAVLGSEDARAAVDVKTNGDGPAGAGVHWYGRGPCWACGEPNARGGGLCWRCEAERAAVLGRPARALRAALLTVAGYLLAAAAVLAAVLTIRAALR